MVKKRNTSNGKKVWHTEDTTFNIDAVTGLFDRETGDPDWKTKAAYRQFPNTDEIFNSDMWTRETVIRDEKNSLSLYDEVVAALSVPKSGLRMYDKNKRGDFALRQEQRNLIQAEKFTLTDNFVRMAVALNLLLFFWLVC